MVRRKRVRANGEGSVYRQKEGLWAASITVDGKRRVFYGKTQREAKDKRGDFLQAVTRGVSVDAKKQTVEEFLVRWLEDSQKQSVRPRTYERYEEVVRLHIVPMLGKYQLQKLSPEHVQSLYARKLEAGFSETTVHHIHNVLHKALKTAMKWGLIPRNVCELVDAPRKARFEGQALTVEQARRLLVAARGHRMEALFHLELATGMRRGEIMGLKWQDINFEKGLLRVQRILSRVPSKLPGKGYVEAEVKTAKSRRTIVVAPFALEMLKRHRERQAIERAAAGDAWEEHDYVFCTAIGTHLNPTRDILDVLKALLKEAGLPDIRFHDLRHSVASLLFEENMHPKVVQEILGHSNISITLDVYSHMLPTMQSDAPGRLDDLLKE
jgi:integrase